MTWASLGFGDFDKLRAGPWTLDLGFQAVGLGGAGLRPSLDGRGGRRHMGWGGRRFGNFWHTVTYCLVERQIMYCNYCGKVIQDDAAVCAYCGIRVGASVARKRLVRPRQGRKVAGVCLGFAEYFDIDVSLVRVVWLITAIMTGVGFIPYFIAWIVMPEEPYLLPAQVSAQTMTNA